MNDEQLKRAKELEREIESIRKTLRLWGESKALCNEMANVLAGPQTGYVYLAVPPHLFEIMRSLSLVYFQDLLSRAEREFSEL